jgi:hypothetical protein
MNIPQASPALSVRSIVVRRKDMLEAAVDGEVVALDAEKGMCYGLDSVGSRIWTLLAEPRRVSNLCAVLVSEYDVDAADCERDVLVLLEELHGEGLIATVASEERGTE